MSGYHTPTDRAPEGPVVEISALDEIIRRKRPVVANVNTHPFFSSSSYHTPIDRVPVGPVVGISALDKLCFTKPDTIKMNIPNHGLQQKPLYPSEYSQGISVYDEINRDNVQQVPNYVTDIYQRLYCAEVSCFNPEGLIPVNLLRLWLTLRSPFQFHPSRRQPVHSCTSKIEQK
jgi:hypothetical protein